MPVDTNLYASALTCPSTAVVGDFVYLVSGTAVDRTDADAAPTMPAIGVVCAKPTPTTCLITPSGDAPFYSSLTPGAVYYASGTPGGISKIPGSVIQAVAVAKDASTLTLFPDSLMGITKTYITTDVVAPGSDDGTPAGTGVTHEDSGTGNVHKTVLTLVNTPIPLVDEAGVVAYGGLKIFDFPQGNTLFLGAVADLALTKSSAGVDADWNGDVGIGTVTASNDATLATTEQNLIPTTATPQAVAGVTTADAKSTTTETGKIFDGTATAIDAFLNLLVDDSDHNVTGTPCNLIANGTVSLTWVNLGDL